MQLGYFDSAVQPLASADAAGAVRRREPRPMVTAATPVSRRDLVDLKVFSKVS
jgi:hypothetical protein